MARKRLTQNEWVLNKLLTGQRLTPKKAMDRYGIGRLAARISDLRKQDWCIQTRRKAVKNRFGQPCYVAEYWVWYIHRMGKDLK